MLGVYTVFVLLHLQSFFHQVVCSMMPQVLLLHEVVPLVFLLPSQQMFSLHVAAHPPYLFVLLPLS